MRCFQIQNNAGWTALLFLAAGLGSLLLATPAQAVTPAEADTAFSALNKVYWDPAAQILPQGRARVDESRFLVFGAALGNGDGSVRPHGQRGRQASDP